MGRYSKHDCVHFDSDTKCKLDEVYYISKSCDQCPAYLTAKPALTYDEHVTLSIRNLDLAIIDKRERIRTVIAVVSALVAIFAATVSYWSYSKTGDVLTKSAVEALVDERIRRMDTTPASKSLPSKQYKGKVSALGKGK